MVQQQSFNRKLVIVAILLLMCVLVTALTTLTPSHTNACKKAPDQGMDFESVSGKFFS